MKVVMVIIALVAGDQEPAVWNKPMPDINTCIQEVNKLLTKSVGTISKDVPRISAGCVMEFTGPEASL